MKQVQYVVVIVFVAVLVVVCSVEVMRAEDPNMANREALLRDLTNLAVRAQDYYHRPMSKGGGQGEFSGLTASAAGLAKLTSKSTNSNGSFSIITAGDGTSVELLGLGTQIGTDGSPIYISILIFADSTYATFAN